VIVPVEGVERGGAERAALALIPVAEDVPEEAGLGGPSSIWPRHSCPQPALFGPAGAGLKAQVRTALGRVNAAWPATTVTADHLAVLGADDDARATELQEGGHEAAAEQEKDPSPTRTATPRTSWKGVGMEGLLWCGFTPSARSWGIDRLIPAARSAGVKRRAPVYSRPQEPWP